MLVALKKVGFFFWDNSIEYYFTYFKKYIKKEELQDLASDKDMLKISQKNTFSICCKQTPVFWNNCTWQRQKLLMKTIMGDPGKCYSNHYYLSILLTCLESLNHVFTICLALSISIRLGITGVEFFMAPLLQLIFVLHTICYSFIGVWKFYIFLTKSTKLWIFLTFL